SGRIAQVCTAAGNSRSVSDLRTRSGVPHLPFFHCAQLPSMQAPAKRKRISGLRPALAVATNSRLTGMARAAIATVASGCTMPMSNASSSQGALGQSLVIANSELALAGEDVLVDPAAVPFRPFADDAASADAQIETGKPPVDGGIDRLFHVPQRTLRQIQAGNVDDDKNAALWSAFWCCAHVVLPRAMVARGNNTLKIHMRNVGLWPCRAGPGAVSSLEKAASIRRS